jgi:hypothetical protein
MHCLSGGVLWIRLQVMSGMGLGVRKSASQGLCVFFAILGRHVSRTRLSCAPCNKQTINQDVSTQSSSEHAFQVSRAKPRLARDLTVAMLVIQESQGS